MSGRRPLGVTLVAVALLSQMPAGWSRWLTHVPEQVARFVVIPGESVLNGVSSTLRPGAQRSPVLPPDILAQLAALNEAGSPDTQAVYDNYLALRARNQRLENRVAALEEELARLSLVREGDAPDARETLTISLVS